MLEKNTGSRPGCRPINQPSAPHKLSVISEVITSKPKGGLLSCDLSGEVVRTVHKKTEPELGLETHLGAHQGQNWVKSASSRAAVLAGEQHTAQRSWHIPETSISTEEASG